MEVIEGGELKPIVRGASMSDFTFLRISQVRAITGLPVSTLYRLMQQGRFPQQVQISPRAVAWRSDEIDEWMQACQRGAIHQLSERARKSVKQAKGD